MKADTEKWLNNISKHPKDVEEEYDKIFSTYDSEMVKKGYAAPQQAGVVIKEHISNPDGTLIEAGCGTGLLGIELNQHNFSDVVGLDISLNSLKEAESKGVYSKTLKHNLLEPLPFTEKSAEGVVSIGVFSRFSESEIKQILNHFSHVTKDDGTIIFSHRQDLISPLLFEELETLEHLKVEKVTEPVDYFCADEHYKDIKICFFVLRKSINNTSAAN